LVKERQIPGKRLVVSLFARAQDQYLFPGSVENAEKHVLDDRGLIRWWCRVLDPIVKSYAPEVEKKSFGQKLAESSGANGYASVSNGEADTGQRSQGKTTAKGYLIIPGFDIHETMRHTPSASSQEPPRWTPSHPLLQLAPHPAAPPRCLIPHFPDDPKSRFLDELDEELPDHGSGAMSEPGGTPSRSNGMWKSVKSLEQFWDMMAYRQECCSGRCVGFIWVVITPPQASIPEDEEDQDEGGSQSQSQSQSQTESQQTMPSPKKPARRRISTRSGPIPPRLPRIKSSVSNLSNISSSSSSNHSNPASTSRLPPESTPFFYWPPSSRGELLFSQKDYARALEVLLQQNFSTGAAAVRSSETWVREVAVLAGVDSWGWSVVGRKVVTGAMNGLADGAVNVLGVRKKRKVDANGEGVEKNAGDANMLSSGLVRKKAKVADMEGSNGSNGNCAGVNVLSAGLVRKKAKPA
jgi:regulator of Ty1 transposition protein 109